MKKNNKLVVLGILAAVFGLGYAIIKSDFVQSKLYDGAHEDLTFAIRDILRLVGDILMWPVDFVRALLP